MEVVGLGGERLLGFELVVGEVDSAPGHWVSGSSLGPLQSSNAGLFDHTEHQRILGRIQIKLHHIGSLAAELRIGTHAPALPALKIQIELGQ